MRRHRLRGAGLALCLVLGAAACGDGTAGPGAATLTAVPDTAQPAVGDTPGTQPSLAPADTPPPSDTGAASPGPATSPTPSVPAASPSGSTPSAELTAASDAGAVGANGRAILRADRPTLVLEVDVQEGAMVDQAALDHLVAELSSVIDKPGGIVLRGGNTFADGRTEWTADDLRAAASAHRSTATSQTEVSVHLLYVRGGHTRDGEQTDAIGLAYSASTVALFPDRWGGLDALLGSARAVERAVLVHELGHLLGLVNLTYTSPIDHEDPEHPGHSSNVESVMYHAVESTLVGQVFNGPPPDTFDEADRADLAGLRDGSL